MGPKKKVIFAGFRARARSNLGRMASTESRTFDTFPPMELTPPSSGCCVGEFWRTNPAPLPLKVPVSSLAMLTALPPIISTPGLLHLPSSLHHRVYATRGCCGHCCCSSSFVAVILSAPGGGGGGRPGRRCGGVVQILSFLLLSDLFWLMPHS